MQTLSFTDNSETIAFTAVPRRGGYTVTVHLEGKTGGTRDPSRFWSSGDSTVYYTDGETRSFKVKDGHTFVWGVIRTGIYDNRWITLHLKGDSPKATYEIASPVDHKRMVVFEVPIDGSKYKVYRRGTDLKVKTMD